MTIFANELFDVVSGIIESTLKQKESVTIAFDGRCASGKTTAAKCFFECFDCNIFHMDDYFLPFAKRTEERLGTLGGNVDRERFFEEVLLPISLKKDVVYRPFNCKLQSLSEEKKVKYKPINIIEGAYSCHPHLFDYYDLHVFFDISHEEQIKRISLRNGNDALKMFIERWIPYEEKYLEAFDIKNKCEIICVN